MVRGTIHCSHGLVEQAIFAGNVWILHRAIPSLILDLCQLALKHKAREAAKGCFSLRTERVSQMGLVFWLYLREKLLYFPVVLVESIFVFL